MPPTPFDMVITEARLAGRAFIEDELAERLMEAGATATPFFEVIEDAKRYAATAELAANGLLRFGPLLLCTALIEYLHGYMAGRFPGCKYDEEGA